MRAQSSVDTHTHSSRPYLHGRSPHRSALRARGSIPVTSNLARCAKCNTRTQRERALRACALVLASARARAFRAVPAMLLERACGPCEREARATAGAGYSLRREPF
eukprot:5321963-Pleurochrysis_carterae.AAC.1